MDSREQIRAGLRDDDEYGYSIPPIMMAEDREPHPLFPSGTGFIDSRLSYEEVKTLGKPRVNTT